MYKKEYRRHENDAVMDHSTRPLDMPKIHCPFVREENEHGAYVVRPERQDGMEWVFKKDDVKATEKLHGTCVSLVVEGGRITSVWNRKNRVRLLNNRRQFIVKGVLNSIKKGYCELPDGQWFGELVGPKVNGNPYQLPEHVWIPFSFYAWDHLVFNWWGKYPKTFESLRKGFQMGLPPLFYCQRHGISLDEAGDDAFVEGVVFVDPETGRMAKLRCDMWSHYYKH